jgi:hypothetical protein
MTEEQLKGVKAPFFVQQIGKRGKPLKTKSKIIGFRNCDPLGVGFPTAHFENGGWLLLSDLLNNYVLS